MWLLMKIFTLVATRRYPAVFERIYRVDDLELFHLTSSFSSSVIKSDSVSLP